MDKHSFSYEQYCSVVKHNIVLEETSFYDGSKKIKCLNLCKCKKDLGGCENKFVLRKQEMIENRVK